MEHKGEHKGDFLDLLKEHDSEFPTRLSATQTNSADHQLDMAEGTTVFAVRYKEGVLIAGDRRATVGTSIFYDQADKVLPIDEYSVLAIAGSPAIAYEMARLLEHSFQYFRRSQLQELSVEGKLRMLSRLLRDNVPMALQGIGGVIPIFALYDVHSAEDENGGKIFFYDALGAHFESADFATSGSGSVWIRGVLYHLNRWGGTRLVDMDEQLATVTVLRLFDTASAYDAATSGFNPKSKIFPTVKMITREGIQELPTERLSDIYTQSVDID